MRIILMLLFLFSACSSYKMPGGDVSSMSGDTLCYRAAYAKDDLAVASEIAARHLDCAALMRAEENSQI